MKKAPGACLVSARCYQRESVSGASHGGDGAMALRTCSRSFWGIALECNRDEWMPWMRRMGSCPRKQPGRQSSKFIGPISLQPFGQMSCRAVCGVAAFANSRAIGCTPRLASHPLAGRPATHLCDPKKDLEQVLTHRPTCAAGCGTCPTGQSPQDQFRPRFGAA